MGRRVARRRGGAHPFGFLSAMREPTRLIIVWTEERDVGACLTRPSHPHDGLNRGGREENATQVVSSELMRRSWTNEAEDGLFFVSLTDLTDDLAFLVDGLLKLCSSHPAREKVVTSCWTSRASSPPFLPEMLTSIINVSEHQDLLSPLDTQQPIFPLNMSSAPSSSSVVSLPYIDLQPDFASVIRDVSQSVVRSEEFWVSGYQQGKTSVHAKVRRSPCFPHRTG